MEYTVVIPAYSCSDEVQELVGQIYDVTPEKYRPARILIVDDGSWDDTRYAHKILNTIEMPVDCHRLDGHYGFPIAAKEGLARVDTDYAVLIHADTRLVGKFKAERASTPALIPDPLGAITHYLSTTEDEVIAVAPFSLMIGASRNVVGGLRMLGGAQIPTPRFRGQFFEPLRNIEIYNWMPAHSVDHYCIALNMEGYSKCPISEECGHFFCFDDWASEVRQMGYYIYITANTVVYHPAKKEKPEGSLSISSEETYTKGLQRFQEKWKETDLWELNSPRKLVGQDEIE